MAHTQNPLGADQIAALPYRPCVGLVIINREGLIFAGQRFDSPQPAWQMPQGGIDPGETPMQAGLRELQEETGLSSDLVELIAETPDWVTYDLPDDLLGKVWGGAYRGQKQRWFAYRFVGRDDQINIATAHPEFSQWCWVAADDLVAGIVPFKRSVYETVISEFRPYLT